MKNKKFLRSIKIASATLVSAFLFMQCSSGKELQKSPNEGQFKKVSDYDPNVIAPNEERVTSSSLATMLMRLPGVQVRGSGDNVSVKIRGAQSLNLTTQPLYVVDGVPLGRDFGTVNRALNPEHIKSIRVLKGNDATMYGARGSNGVIDIRLDKGHGIR